MAKVEILEQAKSFIKKLTKQQKIILGSIIGVVLLGFIIIITATSSKEEYAVLYSSLTEQDAGKILENLKEKNIEYELKDNGTTVLINKDLVYETRLGLANEGLPETSIVGYEIFDRTNLGMSEFVQKLNYRRALEGELAKTIGSMDDVQKVRVHIVIPEKTLFEKDQKQPTASVTLHMKTGRSLSKISIEGIQNLVANSIEGMASGAVTVVDRRGKILSEDPLDDNSIAGLTSSQYEQQTKVEQYLSGKIQSMLDGVLGVGNAEVKVNAELDFTQIEKTITDFNPDRQVVRSEQTITDMNKTLDTASHPTINVIEGQTNNIISKNSEVSNNTTHQQSNVISNYEISQSVERIVEGVGNIKRLSIAALINGTVKIIEKEGEKSLQYTPRGEEEMQKLTLIVKNAVGYDPARNDQVSVLNVPFSTSFPDEVDLEQLHKLPWWKEPENLKLFGLIAAMLITIFLMYKLLQSKHVKDRLRIAFSLPESVSIEEEEEEPEEETEEELEEIEIDDEEFLLLPAELPEQLLLEGEKEEQEFEELEEDETGQILDKDSLAARARAKLEEGEAVEMTEDALMKLELKGKVEGYVDDQPLEAVRLIRFFLSQDFEGEFKF